MIGGENSGGEKSSGEKPGRGKFRREKVRRGKILVPWVLLDKKFWNTFKIIPLTPASRNLNTRPPWLTLTKEALKSLWTSARYPPLSNTNWPALTMSRRASQVPKLFLYEYWLYDRTPDLSKNRPKRKEINLSKNLQQNWCIRNRPIVPPL